MRLVGSDDTLPPATDSAYRLGGLTYTVVLTNRTRAQAWLTGVGVRCLALPQCSVYLRPGHGLIVDILSQWFPTAFRFLTHTQPPTVCPLRMHSHMPHQYRQFALVSLRSTT